MLIYEKNMQDITLEDIENLVHEEIDENKFIEYKSQLSKNDEKKHIPRTVCGFANAEGGIFIYGFNEDQEELEKIEGVELSEEWDKVKQRLIAILRDNLEPHADVEIEKRDLESGKVIILIKVPKSWTPPHRARSDKKREFYIRRDGRTEPMEFGELRDMFDFHNSLFDKINGFRDERVAKFSLQNSNLYKFIFHAIPLNAFSGNNLSLKKLKMELNKDNFYYGDFIYNFEGLYCQRWLYSIQLFRNGIFEAVFETDKEDEVISLEYFEKEFQKFSKNAYKIYKKFDIHCPIIFFVTLANVKGRMMYVDPRDHKRYGVVDKERDCLNPSGAIVENESQIDCEVHNLFVPIWNHFGAERDYISQSTFNDDVED